MRTTSACRIHVLLARTKPRAVVFRRGPSREVLLASWDLTNDRLTTGQWLRGRVYEHRCDLSPSGEYLLVFAAKHKGTVPSWSAISRPPWFSALVTFPHAFGAWGGGGLFDAEYSVRLNHGAEPVPLESSPQPRRFGVRVLECGLGEDDPVRHLKLTRDGWVQTSPGVAHERAGTSRVWREYDPPRIYARPRPKWPSLSLEQRQTGLHERSGPWYVFEYRLVAEGGETLELGRCDWADWDRTGDLLYAQDGCLYRAQVSRRGLALGDRTLVADLRGLRFERRECPDDALA